ncbi:MAG: hypothetical protein IIX68_07925 [Clostridia bacterium]|nr:hypothetical protein [Clostridia bacterium]
MKKWFALILSVVLLAALMVPVSAAQTGVFVDEVAVNADGSFAAPEIVEFSEYMRYESNPDLEVTHLVKAAHKEDVDNQLSYQAKSNHAEYIVYKMNESIGGFELFLNCTAGLGDPMQDVSVYISKTGEANSWIEIKKQATELYYNDDIYINFDKAYWHHSTVMNKEKIPKGYTYLKVQLNACNEKDDVPWNVAIDTIKIVLGEGVAVPTLPTVDKNLTKPSTTASTTTTKGQGGNNVTTTTTTKGQGGNNVTTTTGANGETTTTVANGETTTTVGGNASQDAGATTTTGDNASQDAGATTTTAAGGNGDGADAEPNALPWIIGAVALVVIGAAVVLLVLKKKN